MSSPITNNVSVQTKTPSPQKTTVTQDNKYKREPEDFGLPPRSAGGGSDYIAGIPKHLLNDANIDVVLFADYPINDAVEENIKLCENMDCERYPPDWDFEEDTEDTYQEDQWKKCCLCDGYFNDDGMGDILFVQEEPNNQEAGCSLCGKEEDVVQMKGSGQYLCGNACDESDEDEDDSE